LEPTGQPPCLFQTVTRSDGTYELAGICPGVYDIVATRLIGTAVQRVRLRYVQISPNQTLIVPDLILKAASTVTGRVLLPGAVDNSGVSVLLVGTDRKAVTNAAGEFTIADVEEGTYNIFFSKQGFINQTVSNVQVPPGVTLALPGVVTLKATNPSNFGTIQGVITLEAQTDSSGILVNVNGTDRSAITTSNGAFAFPTLPLSSYTLTFRKQFYFDRVVGPIPVTAEQPIVTLPPLQLDSHQLLNDNITAFNTAFTPTGSAANGEVAITDPTSQIFNQILTSGALATPFAGLSWSPDGNDIIFVRSRSGAGNVSSVGTCRNDGSNLKDLLPISTFYARPAWSPDNTRFVYFLDPRILTVPVDRSTGSLVATTAATQVVDTLTGVVGLSGMEWSGTGRIVYSFDAQTAAGLRSSGIFTIFSTGGGRLQVVPRTNANQTISAPSSPTYRPDFARIGFSWKYPPAATEPPNGVYTMDIDGTSATLITTQPGNNLSWSPDGSRIIYTSLPTEPRFPNRLFQVLVPPQ
jgi:hypothetical protein